MLTWFLKVAASGPLLSRRRGQTRDQKSCEATLARADVELYQTLNRAFEGFVPEPVPSLRNFILIWPRIQSSDQIFHGVSHGPAKPLSKMLCVGGRKLSGDGRTFAYFRGTLFDINSHVFADALEY